MRAEREVAALEARHDEVACIGVDLEAPEEAAASKGGLRGPVERDEARGGGAGAPVAVGRVGAFGCEREGEA